MRLQHNYLIIHTIDEGYVMEQIQREACIAMSLVHRVIAESEESPLFAMAFEEAREKAKAYKQELEEKARDILESGLQKDIQSGGYEIVSIALILGKYRGSRFVTSAKVMVVANEIGHAKALVKILRRYHPRFELKVFDTETKTAEYNIR